MNKRRMSTVEAYALHASISYGQIDPARFAEIVTGDPPSKSEKTRVCQSLTEMHADAISGADAVALADELGITRKALEARCQQLCGCCLGAHAFCEIPPPSKRLQD